MVSSMPFAEVVSEVDGTSCESPAVELPVDEMLCVGPTLSLDDATTAADGTSVDSSVPELSADEIYCAVPTLSVDDTMTGADELLEDSSATELATNERASVVYLTDSSPRFLSESVVSVCTPPVPVTITLTCSREDDVSSGERSDVPS